MLGALRFDNSTHGPAENLDSFKETGCFLFLIRNDGGPLDQGGLMFVVKFGTYRVLQVVFPVQIQEKDMYFRLFNITESAWSSWVKVQTSFIS